MRSTRSLGVGALGALALAAACGGTTVDTTTSSGTTSTSSTSSSSSTGGGGGASSTTTSSTTGAGGAGGATTSTTSSTSSTSTTSTTSTSSGTGGGSPMPVGCVTDVSAGHHKPMCMGGIAYDLEIPAACAAGGCGLVLDMHGFTMTADQEDKGTQLRALGKQHGYVVVQPNAPGVPPSWDQVAHVPLVFAFMTEVAQALLTDPKRAHVMGFSQGGGMTWRMVCAHADFFASAAPIGGLAGCEFVGANVPSREVPVMQVHGRKDNVVNFGAIGVPQREAALAYWGEGPGVVLEDDGAHKATRYLSAAGTPLEFWEHDYQAGSFILGGHCFPGGTDVGLSPFQFGCADQNTFVYGAKAMQFFIDHPKG
jgi:hypothetical protein